MPSKINIAIPTPCHENWDAMTPADKGRFCASCQKHVYDFTKASDREIALVFKTNDEVCGRFRNNQLNRDLIIPKEKNTIWAAASAVAVSMLALGSAEAVAQEVAPMEKFYASKSDVAVNSARTTKKTVRGLVTANVDGFPIQGASVTLNNSGTCYKTAIDGKFSIEVSTGDEINFSYIGMTSQTIIINDSDYYEIKLLDDICRKEKST